jgi:hypothetical protein
MKRIFLALAGAFTITISASTYAAEPLSFGAKLGAVNSVIMGLDKARTSTAEAKFFNPGGFVSAYVEYAFHDNFGIGVEAGYFGGQIGSFRTKNDKDSKNDYSIFAHGVKFFPTANVYPMGRENEDGIFKIKLGPDFYIPVAASGKKESETKATKVDRKELAPYGIGVIGGIGYEFPFGLELELRYSHAFTNVFTKDSTFKKTSVEMAEADPTNLMALNFSFGYNVALLLEE